MSAIPELRPEDGQCGDMGSENVLHVVDDPTLDKVEFIPVWVETLLIQKLGDDVNFGLVPNDGKTLS